MQIVNSNKKNIKKRKNNSGFTLVELLATLSILSLVSLIIIYTVTNVIKSAKDNSYMVTINNIEKESGTYVLENDKNIVWIDDGASLYQCITVQNLIDMGYFDNNILDSKVSEDRNVKANDYIYIEKDKNTKTVTRQVLLYDENSEFNELCGNYINSDGIINFDIPNGWAKSKDITITYKLFDSISVGDSTNYKYGYDFLNDTDEYASFGFTTLKVATKKVTVNTNGYLFADIKGDDGPITSDGRDITGIDNVGPNVTENISNQTVRGSVSIPLKISDSESGVDGSTISLSDFKVSIGGNILTSGVTLTEVNHDNDGEEINYYNYNLIINNRNYAGEVVIELDKDKISDKLGNKNEAIILNTGVTFRNTYTISYDSNGGSGCSGSKTVVYNTNIGDLCKPTREGYTFIGWFDSSYKNTPLNYYADTYSDLKSAFGYDVSNLWNHYLTYGKNENRRISQYVSSDIFESEDDITIYAGWKANTYTIKYNANGGSGSMADTICTYDKDCKLSANMFTRTGYIYGKWNTKEDGSGNNYANGQTVRNLTSVDGASITMYAIYNVNKVYIQYSNNGGSVTETTMENGKIYNWTVVDGIIFKNEHSPFHSVDYGKTLGTYGLVDYNNSSYIKVSRDGYHVPFGFEWKCLSGCTTPNKIFSQTDIYSASDFCDASNGNCPVVLGVNWEINTYTISYDSCGGSGTPAVQIKMHGTDLILSTTKPTKNNYTFVGWSTASSCSAATSKNFDIGDKYTANVSDTLYAVWKRKSSSSSKPSSGVGGGAGAGGNGNDQCIECI